MLPNVQDKRLIAFVSNSAWSVYNFRIDVIRHLLGRGFNILVLAPDDEHSALLQAEGCMYVPIDFNNRHENPLQDYALYSQLKTLYKKYNPDFIFHFVIKPNIYGSLAAARLHIPSVSVITGLGYPFAKKNWLYIVVRLLYKRALRKVTEVWFLNNEDARAFTSHHIIPIKKVKVLPGEGVNIDYFSPAYEPAQAKNGRFVFLMSSRLLKSKGIGLYADAARILKQKNIDARFELLGFFEKHHPDSLTIEEIRKWEQEGLIHFNGYAKDVRPYLKNADCFVFPSSYNEGIPRGLMEAASMELPIVTALNRGCKEVVLNYSNGYLCNPNDPFDLADKMEKMMNLEEEERKRMGKNGRTLVSKKFNVEKVIQQYDSILKTIT
ncbi:MAG TPA: glycosyltransferase family 4 protein [Chitinophagaceae bacterium]|nr:glycosyltransferase family 4 protein [Chitinophagaceae bacterium]